MLILDACRNTPVTRTFRSGTRGLATILPRPSASSADSSMLTKRVPLLLNRVNANWPAANELKPLAGVTKLNQDETLEMAFSMMSNRQKQHFKEVYEVDIGYGVTGLGRFRVNIFQQRNSIGIVARVISDAIRDFTELGLPPRACRAGRASTSRNGTSRASARSAGCPS